jgi:hypothetical protein
MGLLLYFAVDIFIFQLQRGLTKGTKENFYD